MSNITIKSVATSLGSALNPSRLTRQLGIGARLAISFLAVAALAVAANLIAEGRVTIYSTTREPIAPQPAPVTVVAVPAPAPAKLPAADPVPARTPTGRILP
jgi:hypothetical protein